MSIIDGSAEYQLKTASSIDDLTSSINNLNISTFAHTFLDDTSANEVRNTLDLISKTEQGYRQPNTAYSAGNIAYHKSLPIGWYMECVVAGTTANSDLSINYTNIQDLINNTITDGTVKWRIFLIQNSLQELYTGANNGISNNGDLNDFITPGTYVCASSNIARTLSNCPHASSNFKLIVSANTKASNNTNWWGNQLLISGAGSNTTEEGYIYFRTHWDDKWGKWERISTDDRIVEECSFSASSSYIKFGKVLKNLIIQFGNWTTSSSSPIIIDLPISIPNNVIYQNAIVTASSGTLTDKYCYSLASKTQLTITHNFGNGYGTSKWIVIGY